MSGWQPVTPADLPPRLAAWLAADPGLLRVAVDAPPAAEPDALAAALIEPLRVLGRPAVHIRAESFWRDASLRLEYGREDAESYLHWLDTDALRREVLDAAQGGSYLPSLRDPDTNRSTRESPRELAANGVLIVSGTFLLGVGLPFDRTVHIALSSAARSRRTAAEQSWTLPAFDTYDRATRPASSADVVIKWDDRRHPAVRGLPVS